MVAEAFIAARLVTGLERGGITTLEVSHEALIRGWVRLGAWLREARADVRVHLRVTPHAAEWQRRGRPLDSLYRGAMLVEGQGWAARQRLYDQIQRIWARDVWFIALYDVPFVNAVNSHVQGFHENALGYFVLQGVHSRRQGMIERHRRRAFRRPPSRSARCWTPSAGGAVASVSDRSGHPSGVAATDARRSYRACGGRQAGDRPP